MFALPCPRLLLPGPLLLLLLVGCGEEPGWLSVTRVEPARSAEGAAATLYLNQVVTVHFSRPIDSASVSPEALRMVDERGYAVPGALEVGRRSLRFRPVPPVTPELDDGSFAPGRSYRLEVLGMPHSFAIRSRDGRPLERGVAQDFVVPRRAEDTPLPSLFLPVEAGGAAMALDLSAGGELRVAADVPELDLHFTRPVLPASARPEAFRFLRVDPDQEMPQVVLPARVSLLPRQSPRTRHYGCSLRVEFDPGTGLLPGDLLYLTFADSESTLRDYRDRALQPPEVPLRVMVDPGDQARLGDLDLSDLQLEATGREPLGFEVRDGRIRPRARVEAGSGALGPLLLRESAVLQPGVDFQMPDGRTIRPGSDLEFSELEIPDGVELRLRASRPLILRICGRVRIAGRLVLETPEGELPWATGSRVGVPELLRSAGLALVAAGPIQIDGRVSREPCAEGFSPLSLISAAGLGVAGRLPRDTLIALEEGARFDGFAESVRLLRTELSPGLPAGIEMGAEAWTAWLPIPVAHSESVDFEIVDPGEGLRLRLLLAPALAVMRGERGEELRLLVPPIQLPAESPIAIPPGAVMRIEMTTRVRGPEMASFGGFTVHARRDE